MISGMNALTARLTADRDVGLAARRSPVVLAGVAGPLAPSD
jgi:hypothetical protein